MGQNALERAVSAYELTVNGISFRTPYWINSSGGGFRMNAPFRGKATAGQLRVAAMRLADQTSPIPATGEEYRVIMRRAGYGVDCSGFTYHVLQAYLRAKGFGPLSRYLYLTHDDLAGTIDRFPERASLDDLPHPYTMEAVCRRWHKYPPHYTNVQRLISSDATVDVTRSGEIVEGDLIKLTGTAGDDHIVVVIRRAGNRVHYAQSVFEPIGLGGVTTRVLTITDPELGLEYQDFPDRAYFNPEIGDSVRRLRILNRERD
jgi:hypothetical protein